MSLFRFSSLALAVALLVIPTAAAPDPKPTADFTLTDPAGKAWTLHDQKAKAVVIAFLSADCPMSNSYLPTLADVSADLLHGLVDPVPAVEADRDDVHQDSETDAARVPERAGVA